MMSEKPIAEAIGYLHAEVREVAIAVSTMRGPVDRRDYFRAHAPALPTCVLDLVLDKIVDAHDPGSLTVKLLFGELARTETIWRKHYANAMLKEEADE